MMQSGRADAGRGWGRRRRDADRIGSSKDRPTPKAGWRSCRRAARIAIQRALVRTVSIERLGGRSIPEPRLSEDPAQGGRARLITEDSLGMPFVPVAAGLQRSRWTWPRASTRLLRNVRYCAANDLLLTPTRKVVEESSSTERAAEREAFRWRDLLGPEAARLEGLSTTIRSLRNNHYHTLVDNLPRLFLLHHPAHADRELRLLLPGGATPTEAYFLDRLAPPNLTRRTLDPGFVYPCEELLFPEFPSRRFSGALPTPYLEFFRDRVLPRRPRRRTHRILISRSRAGTGRSIRNGEELEAALEPLGFRSWALEDLGIEEQIELFHDAAAVVAPHGAGLANLLFAADVDVLELHPMPRMYPHYYFMCRALEHRYAYWCGDERDRHASFRVDVPAVLRLLEKAGIA